MKQNKKMKRLLEQMGAIERMERGKLCAMRAGAHYNHQTWRDGRNEVRYIPKDDVAELKKEIDGYQRYIKLVEQYADEVIRATRCNRKKKNQSGKTKS